MIQRALTLLELIIVISIVALLLALLLPTLSQARQLAQSTVCQSNQRQFGVALWAYTNDYGNAFPTSRSYYQDLDITPMLYQRHMLAPYVDVEKPHADDKRGVGVFYCPGNSLDEKMGENSRPGRSYGYNRYLGAFQFSSQWMHRIDHVQEPSMLIYQMDWAGRKGQIMAHVHWPFTSSADSTFRFVTFRRHRNISNGLLVDGHVEAFTYERLADKTEWLYRN